MKEHEVVQWLKQNRTLCRPFGVAPKEAQEWVRKHRADCLQNSDRELWRTVPISREGGQYYNCIFSLPVDFELPEAPVEPWELWNEAKIPFRDMRPAVQVEMRSRQDTEFEHICAGQTQWVTCLCNFRQHGSENANAPHRIKGGRPDEFERKELYLDGSGYIRTFVGCNSCHLIEAESHGTYVRCIADGIEIPLEKVPTAMHQGKKCYVVMRKGVLC